jgi:hypothetical protein
VSHAAPVLIPVDVDCPRGPSLDLLVFPVNFRPSCVLYD